MLKVNVQTVLIDAVKKPMNSEEDILVVRLYETCGSRGKLKLSSDFNILKAYRSNIMEEKLETLLVQEGTISLEFTPFKIVTLLIKLGK